MIRPIIAQRDQSRLIEQCNRMLDVTPAAFVFNYSVDGCDVGQLPEWQERRGLKVSDTCAGGHLTASSWVLPLPVSDPKITSARIADLAIPVALDIKLTGEITLDEGSSLP